MYLIRHKQLDFAVSSQDSLLPSQFFLNRQNSTILNNSCEFLLVLHFFPHAEMGVSPFPSSNHNACDWIIVFLPCTKSCPLHSRSNRHTFIWLMLSWKMVSMVLPNSLSTAYWCWISPREFYFSTAFLLPSNSENASVNSGCLSFRGEYIDI